MSAGALLIVLATVLLPMPATGQENPACPGPASRDPSWSPDGTRIVFTSNRSGRYDLWSIGASGGNPTRLTATEGDEFYPIFSPDGMRIAFFVMTPSGQQVGLVGAEGGPVETLTDPADDAADPSWFPDGRLVYSSIRSGTRNLWMSDPDGAHATLLFDLDGEEWAPRISPGGDRVLFQSDREGSFDVYTARLDGTDRKPLARTASFEGVASWSPDGATVAYYRRSAPESDTREAIQSSWATAEVLTVPAAGGPSRALTRNAHRDQSPSWSPDGRTIAWTSCASGNLEVWSMDADGGNARQLTRTPVGEGAAGSAERD